MARWHNRIGSLLELLNKFHEYGIYDFNRYVEIRDYRNNFKSICQKIVDDARFLLASNISELERRHEQTKIDLQNELEKRANYLHAEKARYSGIIQNSSNTRNWIKKGVIWTRARYYQFKLRRLQDHFEEEKIKPFLSLMEERDRQAQELDDKRNNTEMWVDKLSADQLSKARRIMSILDSNSALYFGTEGESKAFDELNRLPDSYVIVNNFRRRFREPIYYRRKNDRIYSIQIDHIVIGPTGIFLIETKNWSSASVDNKNFFSPIEQIRRSSHALFTLLNRGSYGGFGGVSGRWGNKKVSPKSILLLIGNKPNEEYQFVKIATLDNIRNIIMKDQVIYSPEEVNYFERFLT